MKIQTWMFVVLAMAAAFYIYLGLSKKPITVTIPRQECPVDTRVGELQKENDILKSQVIALKMQLAARVSSIKKESRKTVVPAIVTEPGTEADSLMKLLAGCIQELEVLEIFNGDLTALNTETTAKAAELESKLKIAEALNNILLEQEPILSEERKEVPVKYPKTEIGLGIGILKNNTFYSVGYQRNLTNWFGVEADILYVPNSSSLGATGGVKVRF